jgi:hypothetical protein
MRRGPLAGTLSLFCCLNRLSSTSSTSLHSEFRSCFVLDEFSSNALMILVLCVQIVWIVELMRPNSWHTSAFLFPFSISYITLTFSSTHKTFLLFVILAMLSLLVYC